MIKGIDVSKWQGKIDWKKVKNDGIQFAMIRVSHGTEIDPMFKANIEGATAVGLPVGGYFYSYAVTVAAAQKEAQTAIKALDGYKLAYPLAFDQEDARQAKLDKRLNTDMCKAACDRVQESGFIPAIYSNPNWLKNYVIESELQDYDLWLARWAAAPGYDCAIWQYTDKGRVDGINTDVDMNIAYKQYHNPPPVIGEVIASVNVRVAPSTKSKIIGKLAKGTKTAILGTEGDWHRVEYDGRDGYVYAAYLTANPVKMGVVYNVNSALNLREEPSIKAKILLEMPNGAKLDVYGKTGDWCHVRYNGKVGYAHSDHVRV